MGLDTMKALEAEFIKNNIIDKGKKREAVYYKDKNTNRFKATAKSKKKRRIVTNIAKTLIPEYAKYNKVG